MAAAIGVRSDYTSVDLRQFARRSGDPAQVRRLLAVALILDGGSRSEAAKVAGITLQTVRDWVRNAAGRGRACQGQGKPGSGRAAPQDQPRFVASPSRADRASRRSRRQGLPLLWRRTLPDRRGRG